MKRKYYMSTLTIKVFTAEEPLDRCVLDRIFKDALQGYETQSDLIHKEIQRSEYISALQANGWDEEDLDEA